ncbi:MAG: pseudouridine-5'-phosphate glycosidase, partial [Bacteroidota bacterium]
MTLDFSPAVQRALADRQALVALESTIIAHGMPYPENVATARQLEALIRAEGAIPATIAVLKGRVKIGLREDELEYLGKHPEVMKASRRDLAYVLSLGKSAATTVATTMLLAAQAGIKVFATGGIGGVHREAEKTFDISADLQELARTPVAVVSAGAKAILDLGLTLEYLETMGVPVIGVGTQEFPAFYSRESGFKAPLQVDRAEDIARLMHQHWSLPHAGGILLANPIPEQYSMNRELIEESIQQALAEAKVDAVAGKHLTPFLLSRIKELTAGQSLFSNIELVKHN